MASRVSLCMKGPAQCRTPLHNVLYLYTIRIRINPVHILLHFIYKQKWKPIPREVKGKIFPYGFLLPSIRIYSNLWFNKMDISPMNANVSKHNPCYRFSRCSCRKYILSYGAEVLAKRNLILSVAQSI